jgi:hypothetical protein
VEKARRPLTLSRIMAVMDERLAAVASARGGVFTSGHASALGLDDTALTRLRRTGDVLRPWRCMACPSTGSTWRPSMSGKP